MTTVPTDTPDAHPEAVREPPEPTPVHTKRLTLSARVDALEKRLDDVIAVQAANTPIFKAALERILAMREAIHEHSNSLMRLESLAQKATLAQETMGANVQQILAFMTNAKTWGGYVKKYTPRTLTFLLGIAVARGWISAGDGHNLLAIFH